MRCRRVLAPFAAVAGAFVLVGCGTPGLGSGAHYSVSGALHELPYVTPGDSGVTVLTGDLDDATELAGTSRPKAGATSAIAAWLKVTDGSGPVAVQAPREVGLDWLATDVVGKQLGFDATAVRTFAGVVVDDASFTVETVAGKAKLKKSLPMYGGLNATGKGTPGSIDKGLDSLDAGPFTVIESIAQDNDLVAMSPVTNLVKSWQDGKGKSLADNVSLAAVAEALDKEHPYSTMLYAGTFARPTGNPPTDQLPVASTVVSARAADRFDAVGIGATVEKGRAHAFVSYHFAKDAKAAGAAITKLWQDGTSKTTRKPLADLVTARTADVDGDVVTIELIPKQNSAAVIFRMLERFDTPFSEGTT
jgi:hypothetical protein